MKANSCGLACLFLLCLIGCAGSPALSAAASPRLTKSGDTSQGLNNDILSALRSMPAGLGYASDRAAEIRLAERGVLWRGAPQLSISPAGASPTFCSSACYMALLLALQNWERSQPSPVFSTQVWQSLRIYPQHPDGYLSWGRINANGPGLAKWVYDLRAGVNFSSVQYARPGDFLKFFHSSAIGAHERGHLVIFLGLVEQAGQKYVRYWSCNKPGGYGVRMVLLQKMHHPIFTRITHPERIARVVALPASDPWLAAMLSQDCPYSEVRAKCSISEEPARQ